MVKEEIRVNVHNQPYGGFPWLSLPAVLFDTFPNAHDGYGAFAELESATVEDARDFFAHYYAPGNAVLAVSGDLDPDATIALVERHFGDIPRRRVPARPDFAEPGPTSERRQEQVDEHAPAPAVALAWRVPDPADLAAYLPVLALGGLLGSGDASRLNRRLVQSDRIATDAGSHVAFFQNPLDVRDPTALIAEVRLPEGGDPDAAVRAVDEERSSGWRTTAWPPADAGLRPGPRAYLGRACTRWRTTSWSGRPSRPAASTSSSGGGPSWSGRSPACSAR